jgi:hypothetical protein
LRAVAVYGIVPEVEPAHIVGIGLNVISGVLTIITEIGYVTLVHVLFFTVTVPE